jgi:hypothetical protein
VCGFSCLLPLPQFLLTTWPFAFPEIRTKSFEGYDALCFVGPGLGYRSAGSQSPEALNLVESKHPEKGAQLKKVATK